MNLNPKDWIAIGTGVAGLAASALATIRYFVKKEQLEGEARQLQKSYDELDVRFREMMQIVGSSKVAGTAAMVIKAEVDAQLEFAMKALSARASSILVPLPGKNNTDLVFLCAAGPAAPSIVRTTVSINKGIAGFVFTQGKPYLAVDTRTDREFFKGVDVLSSYTTTDMLCVPIKRGLQTLGVLQFLNKTGGAFNQEDLDIADRFAASLVANVDKFLADGKNFELLGFSPAEQTRQGSILFCDLTASSLLLDCMNFASAISLINAYLERSCDIAMKYGGTVDKLLGDGAMLRFNVPHPITDPRMKAIRAAIEMRDMFEQQKTAWMDAGMPVKALYTRIGIACGPVREAIMGHPQFQSLTVVGEPIVLAANLCNGAPRDRSVVLATPDTVAGLEQFVTTRSVPQTIIRKIKGQQTSAYELLACAAAGGQAPGGYR